MMAFSPSDQRERRLLGQIMVSDDPSWIIAAMEPDDFIAPGLKKLFQFLKARHENGFPTDNLSVLDTLLNKDPDRILDAVGEPEGLASMVISEACLVPKGQWEKNIAAAKLAAMDERIKAMAHRTIDAVESEDDARKEKIFAESLILLEQREAMSAGQQIRAIVSIENPDEVRHRALAGIGEDLAEQDRPLGLTFGIKPLDDAISPGLRPGRFAVIGGGTGEGKSIAGMQLAMATARQGLGVLYLSWEMPAEELLERAMAMETAVPAWRIQRRNLREEDVATLEGWHPPMALRMVTAAGLKAGGIPKLVRDARRKLRKDGIDLALMVVDHLQLVELGRQTESRALEVKSVANLCKEIALTGAGEGPLAVLALSQLKRDRNRGRPTAFDLKESGAIEEAADHVLLLWLDRAKDGTFSGSGSIAVEKHRGGKRGQVIDVRFDDQRLLFQ